MLQKLSDYLQKLPIVILAGVMLAASLVLMLTGKTIGFDPAWISVFICGVPLVHAALYSLIFERCITSALLVSIAMVAAIFIDELFAAGEVAFIMAIGGILEEITVARARKGISKLISLIPREGRIISADGEKMVPAEEIKVNDILRVLPGETVPVDGVVISGNTSIDQAVMTGESLPVDKVAGDDIFSGTMNLYGSIDIKAVKVGHDSSLQKMVDLVEEAEKKKAPMQRIVDQWASWLVPIALLIGVATYFITGDIVRAVTVLVVFCPCALALATPTSIMAAIGQGTRNGVLIKSGEALEKMGKVDCVAFDKTGTLTVGKLEVSDIEVFDPGMNDELLLQMAAAVEARSEHPLGKAIVGCAQARDLRILNADEFTMVPGKGIRAIVNCTAVICGNHKYLQENGIEPDDQAWKVLARLRGQGKASILVAMNGVCKGIIALSDQLRGNAGEVVKSLQEMKTETVLLTGDHRQTADYFAAQIGIDKVMADLLPEEKVSNIEKFQQQGKVVCMVGDGVNDAPAMKTANVGVAMGSMGSDIALEAADIALMGDDIGRIPYLKRLSNATLTTIKFNIILAMSINFIAIILSVLGILNPITGALVHNAGSVLVVLNAAMLYDRKYN